MKLTQARSASSVSLMSSIFIYVHIALNHTKMRCDPIVSGWCAGEDWRRRNIRSTPSFAHVALAWNSVSNVTVAASNCKGELYRYILVLFLCIPMTIWIRGLVFQIRIIPNHFILFHGPRFILLCIWTLSPIIGHFSDSSPSFPFPLLRQAEISVQEKQGNRSQVQDSMTGA